MFREYGDGTVVLPGMNERAVAVAAGAVDGMALGGLILARSLKNRRKDGEG